MNHRKAEHITGVNESRAAAQAGPLEQAVPAYAVQPAKGFLSERFGQNPWQGDHSKPSLRDTNESQGIVRHG